ncbi:MAG: hypothetical protein AB9835_13405 [Eubacteriales bacterium]
MDQKNKPSGHKVSDIISIALTAALACVPLAILLTSGTSEKAFDYEAQLTAPAFSLSGYADSSFQSGFEAWFSKNYPLRGKAVTTYNSLKIGLSGISLIPDVPPVVTQPTDTSEDVTETPEEALYISDQPGYALPDEVLKDPSGYRGTETVYIGKNGCLFENGYINEYFGFTRGYRIFKDEELQARVDVLKDMQEILERYGKAMVVVITPSKASMMADYIPDWYVRSNTVDPDYVRPYVRFLKMLEDSGVYHIDSQSVFREVGLQNAFPKTGIHWNKLAAFEISSAMIEEYERQSGKKIPHLVSDSIRFSKNPPGFGNPEQDIYNIVYSAVDKKDSIVDELYYYPDAYAKVGPDSFKPDILVQGGSFCHDFDYYFQQLGVCGDYVKFYYNDFSRRENWQKRFDKADYVILEVNEQFVYRMGYISPVWSQDHLIQEKGNNIIDVMHEFLKNYVPVDSKGE